jgi:hypothetical protein
MFGMMAAAGVLCCAAPGSLGAAHAARCTRILAIFCASFAFFHMTFLAGFSLAVLPEMPSAVEAQCAHPADQPVLSVAFVGQDSQELLGKDGHGQHHKHNLGEDGHGILQKHNLGEDGHGILQKHNLGEDGHGILQKHNLGEDGHGQYSPPMAELFTVKVAELSTKASRRLEEVVMAVAPAAGPAEASSMETHCEQVARFYRDAAPTMVLCAAVVEFCIFLSALMTAKSAARLTVAARKMGANGI